MHCVVAAAKRTRSAGIKASDCEPNALCFPSQVAPESVEHRTVAKASAFAWVWGHLLLSVIRSTAAAAADARLKPDTRSRKLQSRSAKPATKAPARCASTASTAGSATPAAQR